MKKRLTTFHGFVPVRPGSALCRLCGLTAASGKHA